MSEKRLDKFSSFSRDDLLEYVKEVESELESSQQNNRTLWSTLGRIIDHIQISSAGIKAAVTSLLDYDMVWDGSTEHEFLEIIDNNIDLVSNKILLITIASKIETEQLELYLEPNSIEEVISHVVDKLDEVYQDCEVNINISEGGKPILVDFDYFAMALQLLMEIIIDYVGEVKPCDIKVTSQDPFWYINIIGVKQEILTVISELPADIPTNKLAEDHMLPIDKLKLLVMGKLIKAQNIILDIKVEQGSQYVQLKVPMVNDVEP